MNNIKLLAIELINRQKYNVKLNIKDEYDEILKSIDYDKNNNEWIINKTFSIEDVKPYLTPLNLMTTSQQNELTDILSQDGDIMEFCYKHHIDCANLIEKKIAIQMTP